MARKRPGARTSSDQGDDSQVDRLRRSHRLRVQTPLGNLRDDGDAMRNDKGPNIMKRPITSFLIFMREFRETAKERGEKLNAAAGSSIARFIWKEMSDVEKAPYIAEANKLREKYFAWKKKFATPPQRSGTEQREKLVGSSCQQGGMVTRRAVTLNFVDPPSQFYVDIRLRHKIRGAAKNIGESSIDASDLPPMAQDRSQAQTSLDQEGDNHVDSPCGSHHLMAQRPPRHRRNFRAAKKNVKDPKKKKQAVDEFTMSPQVYATPPQFQEGAGAQGGNHGEAALQGRNKGGAAAQGESKGGASVLGGTQGADASEDGNQAPSSQAHIVSNGEDTIVATPIAESSCSPPMFCGVPRSVAACLRDNTPSYETLGPLFDITPPLPQQGQPVGPAAATFQEAGESSSQDSEIPPHLQQVYDKQKDLFATGLQAIVNSVHLGLQSHLSKQMTNLVSAVQSIHAKQMAELLRDAHSVSSNKEQKETPSYETPGPLFDSTPSIAQQGQGPEATRLTEEKEIIEMSSSPSLNEKRKSLKRVAKRPIGAPKMKKPKVDAEDDELYQKYIMGQQKLKNLATGETYPPFISIGGFYTSYEFWQSSLKPEGRIDNEVMTLHTASFNLAQLSAQKERKKFAFPVQMTLQLTVDPKKFRTSTCKTEFNRLCRTYNVLGSDLLYFPIVEKGHWIVCTINLIHKQINTFDSLAEANKAGALEYAANNLVTNFARLVKATRKFMQFDIASFQRYTPSSYPKQSDKNACGVYASLYIQNWDGEIMKEFDNKMIPILRKVIAADLFNHPCNDIEPEEALKAILA